MSRPRRLLSLALVLGLAGTSAAGVSSFTTALTGADVAPAGGDPAGHGFAAVTLVDDQLHYYAWTRDLLAPRSVGLFRGTPGATGERVLELQPMYLNQGPRLLTHGSIAIPANLAREISETPDRFFVQVTSDRYPGGAVRGALAGGRMAPGVLTAHLETPLDVRPTGLAVLNLDAGQPEFYILAIDDDRPTSASVLRPPFRGATGVPFSLPLAPAFAPQGGNAWVALGTSQAADQCLVQALMDQPERFTIQVATSSDPTRGISGRLQPAQIQLFLPVAASGAGHNGTNWRSSLQIINPLRQDAVVTVEFFPTSAAGLTGPGAVRTVTIPGRAQMSYEDLVADLFSMTGSGALRLISPQPIAATSRIFNDQRELLAGTTGQAFSGLRQSDLSPRGMLLGLTDGGNPGLPGYRTNLGFFNPSASPAQVLLTARNSQGQPVASTTLGVGALSQRQMSLVDVFPQLAGVQLDGFYVEYGAAADALLFMYGSVVDNTTGDGTTVLPIGLP